jgi:hypothetical protein
MRRVHPARIAACAPRHALRVAELDAPAKLGALADCLCSGDQPDCALYILRGAISEAACIRFAQNFRQTIAHHGSSRLADGYVTVEQVGATQFGKRTTEYLGQAAQKEGLVAGLFAGLSTADREAILQTEWLTRALADRGIAFAPATHEGRSAGLCVARSWQSTGAFALEPHEDAAQLAEAVHDGFEIAHTSRVFASVACVANGEGGDLVLWNLMPDAEMRAELGLTASGYPYPTEILAGIQSVRVPLRQGDIAFIDAESIHAVDAVSAGTRITVGRFIGRVAPDRVVWWT